MNKILKIFLIAALALLITGCAKESTELDFSKPFTEKQVVRALEENFSKMNKVEREIEEEDKIEGVSPVFYQLENDEGLVGIYVFDSLRERKEAGSWNSFFGFDYESNKKRIFSANNVLVKYQWTEDKIEHWKTASNLGDIVLKKLNPYEEISFFGQGEYWMGFYKIGYYEYFSEDEKGTLIYDAWNVKEGKAVYKRWEPQDEFQIAYKLDFPHGSISGETVLSSRELKFSHSASSGASFNNTESLEMEISWEGKTEKVILHKNDVEIRYEADKDVPEIVKEMAYDNVRINVDFYNSLEKETVKDAKITGISRISTGTASEMLDIQMWLLEYRILSESEEPLILAGGMTLDEEGWRTEYASMGQPIIVVVHYLEGDRWEKIGMTSTGTIAEENNEFSNAAVEMFEKYSQKN